MEAMMIWANGDSTRLEIQHTSPPGRLLSGTSEMWLDVEAWANEGQAVYREVAATHAERAQRRGG